MPCAPVCCMCCSSFSEELHPEGLAARRGKGWSKTHVDWLRSEEACTLWRHA